MDVVAWVRSHDEAVWQSLCMIKKCMYAGEYQVWEYPMILMQGVVLA